MVMPIKICCLRCERTRDEHAAITSHDFVLFDAPVRRQPPALPVPHPEFSRITAFWNGSAWTARVQRLDAPIGHGQAVNWLDAVNAAIEDLKEKS